MSQSRRTRSAYVFLKACAVEAFELDGELLDVGPPPTGVISGGGIPRDMRLDATATARALGVELPDLASLLGRLRVQIETQSEVAACRA
jgi:hypothetical protein